MFRFFQRKGKKENVNQIRDLFDQAELSAKTSGKVGNVDVIGLGFTSNMPEYMVAADILVTKAGPGTIAEAASVGLPVLLTR